MSMSSFAAPTLSVALLASAAGCGYTSEYIPPPDGRPRAVMMGTELALVASGPLAGRCEGAAAELVGKASRSNPVPRVVEGDGRFTTGDMSGVGKLHVPAIHLPSVGNLSRVVIPPGFGGFHGLGGVHAGGGGGGGGNMGNMGNMGKGAIIIPIIAMTALTWVALGLALGRPESEAATAAAIDEVNAEHDLFRLVGSPCDFQWARP